MANYNQRFEGAQLSEVLSTGETYDNCSFSNCSFAELHLTEMSFVECRFEGCDFTGTSLGNTSFRESFFKGCKLLGLQWSDCQPMLLSFGFENCQMDYGNFQGSPLKGTSFTDCSLREVDFFGADLRKCQFNNSNLERAHFEGTQLQEADLRTAFGYQIDPEQNYLKGARFSNQGLGGLLTKYGIQIDE